VALEDIRRLIDRAVVNGDKLEVIERLAPNGRNCFIKPPRSVPDRHQHGNSRHRRFTTALPNHGHFKGHSGRP
jgi:hypothetical protein